VKNNKRPLSRGRQKPFSAIVALIIVTCLGSVSLAVAGEPKIVEVKISKESFFGSRSIFVTVEHEDTGWDHYADTFDISTPDGEILSTRVLAHPHVDEQPFTRDARGVSIPDGVTEVLVRAKDSVHGFGETVRVAVPKE